MYDLSNLNDYEFESLCRDIMEKKLGGEFRIFTRGKDGGIDATTYSGGNDIVIQIKHYAKSSYSSLLTAIKKEIKLLSRRQKGVKAYYICTSMALTPANVNELYYICRNYMSSTEHIIDEMEINKFLKNEENLDIVQKHYKLWLAASNVIDLIYNKNVFVDCEDLVNDIESDIRKYVDTQAYYDSLHQLEHKNILIILGMPGIGKSTLSKMLLFYYSRQVNWLKDSSNSSGGYNVRYSSDNNLEDIKRLIGTDDKKEIILLDDFLGQHYLNLSEANSNGIKSLFGMVKKKSNKKLILNTRITIFNEAKRTNYKFEQLMDEHAESLFYLDMDNLKQLDKAKIFYNHIFFNHLPEPYYSEIEKNKNYRRIINHPNYSPGIMEYITQKRSLRNLPSEQYFDWVMSNLENPRQLWKDEFLNRIGTCDRILLYTLYSLGNTWTPVKIAEEAFNSRMTLESGIDTTVNQFEEVFSRLSDSMIKTTGSSAYKMMAFINRSLSDFIFVELNHNLSECRKLISTALYLEQIIKINYKNKLAAEITEKIKDKSIFRLKLQNHEHSLYLIKFIMENNIYEESITEKIKEIIYNDCILNLSERKERSYADLWLEIADSPALNYYQIDVLLYQDKNYIKVLKELDTENAELFINKLLLHYKKTIYYDEVLTDIKDMAIDIVNVNILELYSNKIKELISNELDKILSEINVRDVISYLVGYYTAKAEELFHKDKEQLKERATYQDAIYNPLYIREMVAKIEIRESLEKELADEIAISYADDEMEDIFSLQKEEDEIDLMFS